MLLNDQRDAAARLQTMIDLIVHEHPRTKDIQKFRQEWNEHAAKLGSKVPLFPTKRLAEVISGKFGISQPTVKLILEALLAEALLGQDEALSMMDMRL